MLVFPIRPLTRALPGLVLGLAAAAGLVVTNPDRDAFADYAGERLSGLLIEDLCRQDGLPLLLRLVVSDCPGLVRSQRPALGRIAEAHSRRLNLGLLSFYSTDIGGQTLFRGLQLPRYNALTLAVAGQFVILRTSERAAGHLRVDAP
jgi:hypothetical protein